MICLGVFHFCAVNSEKINEFEKTAGVKKDKIVEKPSLEIATFFGNLPTAVQHILEISLCSGTQKLRPEKVIKWVFFVKLRFSHYEINSALCNKNIQIF